MSLFDWTEDGEQITPEFLIGQGFIPISSYTTRKITWYVFGGRTCQFGISVNIETNTVTFRTCRDMKWVTLPLGDTHQIKMLISQFNSCV